MPLLSLADLRRKFLDLNRYRSPQQRLTRSVAGSLTRSMAAGDDRMQGRGAADAEDRALTPTFPARSTRMAWSGGGCGNPGCSSGRPLTRPWSNQGYRPTFDSHAVCSRACLRAMVALALHRECAGAASGDETGHEPYRHRMPLGLLMLSRGAVTREQLTQAIQAQKAAGQGRLGEWLIAGGISEVAVATSLALQWGVPVLAMTSGHEQAKRLLPRFLVEISGAVPLRVAGGKILYLAVDEQVDRCVNQAIQTMTGYQVEAGVMRPSDYAALRRGLPDVAGMPARLFGPASKECMVDCIEGLITGREAVSARLVRIRDYIWLRMEGPPVGRTLSRLGTGTSEDTIFALQGRA